MKVTDIREAMSHAKRFLTHAEWVLRNCESRGRGNPYGSTMGRISITITDVYGGPGYDVMQDSAHDLKAALKRFRKSRVAGEKP